MWPSGCGRAEAAQAVARLHALCSHVAAYAANGLGNVSVRKEDHREGAQRRLRRTRRLTSRREASQPKRAPGPKRRRSAMGDVTAKSRTTTIHLVHYLGWPMPSGGHGLSALEADRAAAYTSRRAMNDTNGFYKNICTGVYTSGFDRGRRGRQHAWRRPSLHALQPGSKISLSLSLTQTYPARQQGVAGRGGEESSSA